MNILDIPSLMGEIDAFDRSPPENYELRGSICILLPRYFHSDSARGKLCRYLDHSFSCGVDLIGL